MLDELADGRPPGATDSGGRCCSRCSAASTRRGRSPRRGRITCARSAAIVSRRRLPRADRDDRRRPASAHAGTTPSWSTGIAGQRRRRPRRAGRCSRATSATSAASTRRSLCCGRLRPCRRRGRAGARPLPSRRSSSPSAASSSRRRRSRAPAVAAAETETDNVWFQGWGYEDLATVLERAGRIDEAREALERALAFWERKRCLPYAHRVREQIDSLGPTNG